MGWETTVPNIERQTPAHGDNSSSNVNLWLDELKSVDVTFIFYATCTIMAVLLKNLVLANLSSLWTTNDKSLIVNFCLL